MRHNYTKPTPGTHIPTEDEFLSWCENRVTQFVARAYQIGFEGQKEAWMEMSWIGKDNNTDALIELKTREDAYKAFLECGYEDYLKIVENDK